MKKIKEKEFWRKIFQRKEWYDEINKTKVRFEVIEKYVKGSLVLDFGCGTGFFIKKLIEKGLNVIGIDFYTPKINGAKFIKIKDVKDLKKIDLKEKFDTIIASEVLEHLTNYEINKVMKFFYKWLKDDGVLIVTVPYRENLKKSKILCPYCLKWFHPWLHRKSFDEEKLQKLLVNYSFRVNKIKYITFGYLFNVNRVLRLILNFLLSNFFKNRSTVWLLVISSKIT
jgi:2-polyprenyl-3-methyl-5-hydroxy-6-metoxy-1,4-benzoquinol methylase